MERLISCVVLSVVLLLARPFYAGAITGDKPEFKKLADDVYVYVGKRNDANAMVVITSQAMVDYLLIARQRVRSMMDRGMTLEAIRKEFRMDEYKEWDRTAHLPLTAATIYRELRGEGPEIAPVAERKLRGKIAKIAEEGRYLTVVSDTGQQLNLRISNATDIEGAPDRSHLKVGMSFTALYEEQKERNETLEIKIEP